MNCYFIFNLNIRSEFPLHGLWRAGDGSDLVIRRGAVAPLDSAVGGDSEPPRVATTLRESRLDLGEWGRFLVREGREIVVDSDAASDDRELAFFILEHLLVLALYQRGLLVFHASAVAIDRMAVAFLGEPGAGKTALTLAFYRDGGQLIDDDILALDPSPGEGAPWVRPGVPLLKLWPELAHAGGVEPRELVRQFPGQEKLVWPVRSGLLAEPLPLRRVYLLARGDAPALEPLDRGDASRRVLPHWYGLLYAREMFDVSDAYARALAQSLQLTRHVPVARLAVPRDFTRLPDLKRLILNDLESGSPSCR